jgi:Ser/Thr protein kinase RdoA (MazF antagonist)
VAQPDDLLLSWAVTAIDGQVLRSVTDLAQSGGFGPWLLEVEAPQWRRRLVLHAGEVESEEQRRQFALRALAQLVAIRHGLIAPEVVATDDGAETGWLAVLETALSGTSRIPVALEPKRLRALGREAARINAVRPSAATELPHRRRSLEGVPFERLPVPDDCRDIFERAAERVAATPVDSGEGFVHGDLWQGNTLWEGLRYVGAVDWDYAGVGPGGIDLGSLRFDVAVMFGPEAAADVATGWEEELGRPPELLAYWDAASCLAGPADLAYWLPNFHAQGRTDLSITTVTARRNDFLATALAELR